MPRRTSAAVIRARIRILQRQAQKLEQGSTKGLRAVASAVAKHGLSLSDLKKAFALSKNRRGPRAGQRVPIKFKDGKGNTWSGRGRPPLWLIAAEKAGKKRETFLVKK